MSAGASDVPPVAGPIGEPPEASGSRAPSGHPAVPAAGGSRPSLEELRSQVPGLVRIAASGWWHTAEWGVVASAKVTRRLAQAAVDPQKAVELATEVGQAASVVGQLAKAMTNGVPLPKAVIDSANALGGRLPTDQAQEAASSTAQPFRQVAPTEGLRSQGEALLNRSRDVWNSEVAHPAYSRILTELAPDEARILVLLIKSGPQPSVDVRTGGPVGMVSSQLIAPGLNMIGPRAGVRYLDRVPAYLNNLFRLGLVWFSGESLRDPLEYQVVEAQPDVLAAMHSVKFAKVVRRSIQLTPFGEDFCRVCLIDPEQALGALPEHHTPPASDPVDLPLEP